MRRRIAAVAALLLLAAPASAADNVKIGFVTTLSGPAGIIGKLARSRALSAARNKQTVLTVCFCLP